MFTDSPRSRGADANTLPARLVAAATKARRGPDVILMPHHWPHPYRDSLADVGDLCEWKAGDQDGYDPAAAAAARAGSRWLALPYGVGPCWPTWSLGAAADARRVPPDRGPAEAAGPPRRPGPQPHARRRPRLDLPDPLGLRGRRGRRERRPGRARLPRHARVREMGDGVLDGGLRRDRRALGRLGQQSRLPPGEDQRDPERRLDLRRGQAQRGPGSRADLLRGQAPARVDQGRAGRANVRSYRALPAPGRRRPDPRLSGGVLARRPGLLAEPAGGAGAPSLAPRTGAGRPR